MRWEQDLDSIAFDDDPSDPCCQFDPEELSYAPPEHRCGEMNSVARHNRVTGDYFIGCYSWPKCQYSRPAFYPEDEIKISRLQAIHNVTQRPTKGRSK